MFSKHALQSPIAASERAPGAAGHTSLGRCQRQKLPFCLPRQVMRNDNFLVLYMVADLYSTVAAVVAHPA